ncbi:bifunctional non-homologous end joining protein LigD [Quadrisphaera granulorum]|uniref:Bifunctional non-homologous end joining protein LigD n=1 Tax=Quadrisphaera granulorum TaxID=317664 RepID=A0A316AE84_9ACTN|nr:non-homologous end-joining DNA ligase [Quadrisphaera granulorum]PWJ55184.1 bifunctional non-homologous end joining protein LigD [Quadrisphaera granulorum]SZE95693.1 bifunctional non-homologous end joining protein LigD [Quadrisphaera granulorum]
MVDAAAQVVQIAGRRVKLTHLDRELWPGGPGRRATTKAELVSYVLDVAPALLPQLAGRPVTRVRWPQGVGGPRFFEKNVPSGTPQWVRSVEVKGTGDDDGDGFVTYPLVDDEAGLVWLANLSALELHTPQWRLDPSDTGGAAGARRPPDRLVVDLDPGLGTGLAECSELAVLVAERLADDGLVAVPVTSGSKGLQLYAPISGEQGADVVAAYAKRLAVGLAKDHAWVTAVMTKDVRRGKVLLDWSQNNGAKTTITPWSPRGREHPQAAVPRRWDELGDDLFQLSLTEAAQRFATEGDPLAGVLTPDAPPGPRLPER